MKKKINLYHFMPEKLNLYGDIGNIIALKKRANDMNVELIIHNIEETEGIDLKEMDLFFIGGGSDREQKIATEKLRHIKVELKEKIENGTPGLMICGGYQFLGKKYITLEGTELDGLGIFQFETIAKEKRLVGNIILESPEFGLIAGFENHSGRTYHDENTLGTVKKGYGNDDESGKEGLRYNNIIGTYLHGPILPKNPKITDYLLEKSLELKFGKEIKEKDTTMSKYESIAREQALNINEK
jgi:CobQ-like glutamine amidotransferase family enzyme